MARRISKRSEQKGRKTTSSPAQNEASFVVAEPLKRPSVALVIAVVLTAILEVLDITIVSVSIPHMRGSFGATSDQITWVLTSYLVAAAVGMPLTGYLSERLGRRRLLNISIIGFVVFFRPVRPFLESLQHGDFSARTRSKRCTAHRLESGYFARC